MGQALGTSRMSLSKWLAVILDCFIKNESVKSFQGKTEGEERD
jgi:hypothetical protein